MSVHVSSALAARVLAALLADPQARRAEIAARCGVSPSVVSHVAVQNGLARISVRPGIVRRPWTVAEKRRLQQAYGTQPLEDLALEMNRNVQALRDAACRWGLARPTRRRGRARPALEGSPG